MYIIITIIEGNLYSPVDDGYLRTAVTLFGKVARRVFSPPAVGECDAKDRQQAKKQTAGTIHLYINYAKLYTDSILLSTGHSSTPPPPQKKNNNNKQQKQTNKTKKQKTKQKQQQQVSGLALHLIFHRFFTA